MRRRKRRPSFDSVHWLTSLFLCLISVLASQAIAYSFASPVSDQATYRASQLCLLQGSWPANPEHRIWQYQQTLLTKETLPEGVPLYRDFRGPGFFQQKPEAPDQILASYWSFLSLTNAPAQPVPGISLCFSPFNTSSSGALALIDLSRSDTLSYQCQSGVVQALDEPAGVSQVVICKLSLNATRQHSMLGVLNGRLNQACTVALMQENSLQNVQGALALITYQPAPSPAPLVITYQQTPGSAPDGKNNTQEALLPGSGKGPELEKPLNAGAWHLPDDDNGDDYKRRPRWLNQDSGLIEVMPLSLANDEGIHSAADEVGSDAVEEPIAEPVVAQFTMAGNEQTLKLTGSQWQLLVEHGVHRSARWLYLTLASIYQGQLQVDSLTQQLENWLDLAGQEGQTQSGTDWFIDDIIRQLEAIIPERVTIEGLLQSVYENILQDHFNVTPVRDELFDSLPAQDRLTLLQCWLHRVMREERLTASMAEFARDLENPAEMTGEEFSKFWLGLHRPGYQTRPGAIIPGENTAPSGRQARGGKGGSSSTVDQTGSGESQQKQSGSGSNSGKRRKEPSDELPVDGRLRRPPPPAAGAAQQKPVQLTTLVNEPVSLNHTNKNLSPDTSAAEFMHTLRANDRQDLQQFLVQVSGVMASTDPWQALEQAGVLTKGVIIAILWAKDVSATDPFLQSIQGSETIYGVLDRNGFSAFLDDLAGGKDTLRRIFTVLGLARLVKNDYSLAVFGAGFGSEFPKLCYRDITRFTEKLRTNRQFFSVAGSLIPAPLNSMIKDFDRLFPKAQSISPSSMAAAAPSPPVNYLSRQNYQEEFLFHNEQTDEQTDEQTEQALAAVTQLHDQEIATQKDEGWWLERARQILPLSQNHTIKQLDIVELLEQGRFARVYKVALNDEFYALKLEVLGAPESERRQWAKKAAVNFKALQDRPIPGFRNVLVAYEHLEEHGIFLQLMVLMDSNLKDFRPQGQDAVNIFLQVLEQVSLLHNSQLYHRDLKAANIGVRKRDHKAEVFILDLDTLRIWKDDCNEQMTMAGAQYCTDAFDMAMLVNNGKTHYNPRRLDLAALAHLHLYIRYRVELPGIFLQNLDEFLRPDQRRYYQTVQGTNRLILGSMWLRELAEEANSLNRLFELAGVQQEGVTRQILNHLWLQVGNEEKSAIDRVTGLLKAGNSVGRSLAVAAPVQVPEPAEKASPSELFRVPARGLTLVDALKLQEALIRDLNAVLFEENNSGKADFVVASELPDNTDPLILHEVLSEYGLLNQLPFSLPLLKADGSLYPQALPFTDQLPWKEWLTKFVKKLLRAYRQHTSGNAWINQAFSIGVTYDDDAQNLVITLESRKDTKTLSWHPSERKIQIFSDVFLVLENWLKLWVRYNQSRGIVDDDISAWLIQVEEIAEAKKEPADQWVPAISQILQNVIAMVDNSTEQPRSRELSEALRFYVKESESAMPFTHVTAQSHPPHYYPEVAMPQHIHNWLAKRFFTAYGHGRSLTDIARRTGYSKEIGILLTGLTLTGGEGRVSLSRLPTNAEVLLAFYAVGAVETLKSYYGATERQMIDQALSHFHNGAPLMDQSAPLLSVNLHQALQWASKAQKTRPEFTTPKSCHACKSRSPMRPIAPLTMVSKYRLSTRSGMVCDGCEETIFSVDFITHQVHLGQMQVLHCSECSLDLCDQCVGYKPCCPKCSYNMRLTKPGNIASYATAERDIICDQCQDVFARTGQSSEPGVHAIWHCDNGHDLCSSCMLRSRDSSHQSYSHKQ